MPRPRMESSEIFGLIFQRVSEYEREEIAVPLQAVSVDLSVKGFIADVTSTLTYRHAETEAIAAAFVFPMDEQSAVYHFEAELDGKILVGECQTKDEAKETYDTAVEAGHTAFLMNEEKTSDVFRLTVGNLPPKKDAVIRFSYVIELSMEADNSLKFVLPTVLNPRYGDPGTTAKGKERGVQGMPKPYKFSLQGEVSAAAGNEILKIVSETPNLGVVCEEGTTKAKLQLGGDCKLDTDLKLNVFYSDAHKPQAIHEPGNPNASGFMKQDVLMLNFFPESSNSSSSCGEYIFVVDRSGSMSGSKIKCASETLLLFLKSLPVGCYFNVVSFGSSFESLFPGGSKEYNQQTLKEACALQKDMEANFGGTEIFEPLNNIFESKHKKGHPRQIFLLTDGEVWDTKRIIQLVKHNAHNNRVFTFGIGAGASTALVKGVARAGRGTCEFVDNSEKLHSKVMSVLKQARQDFASEIQVRWNLPDDNTVVSIPREVPAVFSGQNLIVYGLMKDHFSSDVSGTAELSWKMDKKDMSHNITICRGSSINGTSLHRLAAKKKIHELQLNEVGDDEAKAKDAIVLLSTSANIVSNHTSFVAVDKESKVEVTAKFQKDTSRDELVQRDALLQCSMGSYALASNAMSFGGSRKCKKKAGISVGGVFSSVKQKMTGLFSAGKRKRLAAGFSAPPDVVMSDRDQGIGCRPPSPQLKMCSASYEDDDFDCSPPPPPPPPASVVADSAMKSPPAPPPPAAAPSSGIPDSVMKSSGGSTLISMIDEQDFDGHWEFSKAVVKLLGRERASLESATPVKELSIWATVLVLAWLQLKHNERKDEWEMIYDKAFDWLMGRGEELEGNDPTELIELAKKALL